MDFSPGSFREHPSDILEMLKTNGFKGGLNMVKPFV
ncbi:unnamed protein product [Brassica rapa subsp. trilocularis]